MPHSFLLPHLYDGETLLSQCPLLSTSLNLTSSLRSISFTLIHNDLSLFGLLSFVYITQCCQYTTELIFPLFSVLTDSFQIGRKTAPSSQPVFKDQWLYPRVHTSSPLINVLFTNSFTACQPESKTQENKACFYFQKSFQLL